MRRYHSQDQKNDPMPRQCRLWDCFESLLAPDHFTFDAPETIDASFLLIDLASFVQSSADCDGRIEEFFRLLDRVVSNKSKFFISDAYYYLPEEVDYKGTGSARQSENKWDRILYGFCAEHDNCFVFPLRRLVSKAGESEFYSDLLWYSGSIRYTLRAEKDICAEIERACRALRGKSKKAIVLDLDNTLWGGVVGEDGMDGIKLADSGIGKAFRDFQRSLKYLKDSGVILCIASKNNASDAWQVIENHPQMILRKDDFAAFRIDWNNKSENIAAMAKELNIGLDSMVFVDDSPNEREEVRQFLPELTIPEFPKNEKDLKAFADQLSRDCFSRLCITEEDKNKTALYHAMSKIQEAQSNASDYSSFLRSLEIVVSRKDPMLHQDRVAQLVEKTNQFNTTVTRYPAAEIGEMLADSRWRVYLYEISDKYANHGLCAEAFVRLGETAVIEDFIMSCRVMGRHIEYGILEDIREDICKLGIGKLEAVYRKGPKNGPVESLYDRAGYALVREGETEKRYEIGTSEKTNGEEFCGVMIS